MPKITRTQRIQSSKPTVIKASDTKTCTICTDKQPAAIQRCSTCKDAPTCKKCVKDWIVNDGGIIDSTGKFVYSCPTCRKHLDISTSMLADADVRTKLYNYFLHEVKHSNVDNTRNILGHYPWLATLKNDAGCTSMHFAASTKHIPMMQLLGERGATMFDKDIDGCMPIHL